MKKIENDDNIPSSIFGENICDIINKEDINKLTIKTLLNIEQNYKKEINYMIHLKLKIMILIFGKNI